MRTGKRRRKRKRRKERGGVRKQDACREGEMDGGEGIRAREEGEKREGGRIDQLKYEALILVTKKLKSVLKHASTHTS